MEDNDQQLDNSDNLKKPKSIDELNKQLEDDRKAKIEEVQNRILNLSAKQKLQQALISKKINAQNKELDNSETKNEIEGDNPEDEYDSGTDNDNDTNSTRNNFLKRLQKNNKKLEAKDNLKTASTKGTAKEGIKEGRKALVAEVGKDAIAAGAVETEAIASAAVGTTVGWPAIAVIAVVIAALFVILFFCIALFSAYGKGIGGNSFAQPTPKNDKERVAFVNKYLGDNAEKSSESSKYPKLKFTNVRDEEFLKNGGTRDNVSLQPDKRIFSTLKFLLEGNEESKKQGFSGFAYVEVSHIVSTYEDIPINREQTYKDGLMQTISAHKKGQAFDISALGMIKQQCECGDKIPVQISFQDDPPETAGTSTSELGVIDINNQNEMSGTTSSSVSSLSNANIENYLNLPLGTLDQGNLKAMTEYATLASLAQEAGLPPSTFVGTDTTQQARIALAGQIKKNLGIIVDDYKLTGNKQADSYINKAVTKYVLGQLQVDKLAEVSSKTASNQQDKVPAKTVAEGLEEGIGMDKGVLNVDFNNIRQLLTEAGDKAFNEELRTRAEIMTNGLNWLEIAKKALKKDIEDKGKIPDGAISEGDTDLYITGGDGNFDSEAITETKVKKTKTPWWQSSDVINSIAQQMGINGSDNDSKQQKEYLKRIISNPKDEQAVIALTKTQGFKLLDQQFKLENGDSNKILSFVEGTAKDKDGQTLSSDQRITETAKILAKNGSLNNIEKEYKLPTGTIAKYLNESDTNKKKQVLQEIGIQRLSSQWGIDQTLLTSIVNYYDSSYIPPISTSIQNEAGTVQDPVKELTRMFDNTSLISKYLKANDIPPEALATYILGDKNIKKKVGSEMAVEITAKELGFDSKDVSTFSDLASTIVGKSIGLSSDTVSGLYTLWFPSQEQKDAFSKTSKENQEAFNKLRLTATENALAKSSFIQSKLKDLNLPTDMLEKYFSAPSSSDDENIETKTDVLFNNAGPLLESKWNLRTGTMEKIHNIVKDPLTDTQGKVTLVATELIKSVSFTNFENQNNLPYKMAAQLFVGGNPSEIIDTEINAGLSILNTKLGLDYYDAKDNDLANWDPGVNTSKNNTLKRYSLQNVVNGKISFEVALSRSSFVKTWEKENNVPTGSVAKLIDSKGDPQKQEALAISIGGQYIDSRLNLTLTEEEKTKYPDGYIVAVLKDQISSSDLLNKVGEQEVMKNLFNKYGIDDSNKTFIKTLVTGKFIDGSDSTFAQKIVASKIVAGDVMGTMLAEQMGLISGEDISLAKDAVKGVMFNDYDASEKLAASYGFKQLDEQAGLPSGTTQALYNGIQKNDWSKFDSIGASTIDKQLNLPSGSTMALKKSFVDHKWSATDQLAGAYIGNKLDEAIGAPSGSSYGAYMWLTTGNPTMFALAITGKSVFKALSKLPVVGGLFCSGGILGIGGCDGNSKCYKDDARTNIHIAIEQLLRAPVNYNLENNLPIQLITYNQERDVDPFAIKGGLLDKAYGNAHSTVYGLFSMPETYAVLHIGF